jgi:ABC-type multidrug transport system fused ATPase/permease subunit
MDEFIYEDEEVTIKPSRQTLFRLAAQLKPYWRWVVGFLLLIAIVAALDSYFTFLSKRIMDEGIIGKNREA